MKQLFPFVFSILFAATACQLSNSAEQAEHLPEEKTAERTPSIPSKMIAHLQTPTNDLQGSIAYYTKLQFELLSEKSPTVVSDGKAVIEINPERFARAGVKLYQDNWEEFVHQLPEDLAQEKTEQGWIVASPSGMWVYLINGKPAVEFVTKDSSTSVLGNCMGLSLETLSLPNSMQFWERFGLAQTAGNPEQGWVVLAHESGFALSLMKANACPHLFFNPSLSYFNGKANEQVIANIRELNIPITEEVTVFNSDGLVDNIIIRDPGGLGFFLFND